LQRIVQNLEQRAGGAFTSASKTGYEPELG